MERFIMIKYEVLTCFVPFVILLFILNYFYKKKYNCGIMRRRAFLLILFAIYIIGVFYFTGSGTIWDGLFKNFCFQYFLRRRFVFIGENYGKQAAFPIKSF